MVKTTDKEGGTENHYSRSNKDKQLKINILIFGMFLLQEMQFMEKLVKKQ